MIAYDPTGDEIVLAGDYHSGQGSMFYAISSTGALSTGTLRPSTEDDDGNTRPMTDAEWAEDLVWYLIKEVRDALRIASDQGETEDAETAAAWLAKLDTDA